MIVLPQMIVGRTDENDMVINHRSISRNHAKITRDLETGRYTISDLQSSNGVRVNGQDYGKELEVHIFGETFTQLGLNFPKIWASNSLPLLRTTSTCTFPKTVTFLQIYIKTYIKIQGEKCIRH